jgi:hypothetical protein
MSGFSICLILLNDDFKVYILLISLCFSAIVIIYELTATYYGGISLSTESNNAEGPRLKSSKSNKVHPMPEQNPNNSIEL